VRIAGDQVESVGEAEAAFELDTFDANLAGLNREERICCVRRENVLLRDVEEREREQRIGADRPVLDADLLGRACRRTKRRAGKGRSRRRLKRCLIGGLGRVAVIEQI
jgi:hypothetical protein